MISCILGTKYNARLDAQGDIDMALSIQKFTLTLSLIGAKDSVRRKSVEILASGVDDATKRSNARIAADNIITAFNAVSTSFVQKSVLSEEQYESDPVPANLENLYTEVVVTAGLDVGGGKVASLTIPAPADEIFVGNSGNTNDVDTSDASLRAFVDLFKSDGASLGALSDGEQFEDPVNILGARVRSVKSGKSF